MFVVLARLEPEQRKLESVLAARLAVASAGVATGLGEYRDDLVGEIDGRDVFKILDRHCQRRTRSVRGFCRYRCVAVAQRCHAAGRVDTDHLGRRDGVADLPGVIAHGAGIESCRQQQLLARIFSAQMNGLVGVPDGRRRELKFQVEKSARGFVRGRRVGQGESGEEEHAGNQPHG